MNRPLRNSQNTIPRDWREKFLDWMIIFFAALAAGAVGFGIAGGSLPWQN